MKIYNPDLIRELLQHYATIAKTGQVDYSIISMGERGAMTGKIEEAISFVDKAHADQAPLIRRWHIGFLFGNPYDVYKAMSSKQLREWHWYALDRWLRLDPDNKWRSRRPELLFEIAGLNTRVLLCHKIQVEQVKATETGYKLQNLIDMTRPANQPEFVETDGTDMIANAILTGGVVTGVTK